jgi:hypothetical protein
MARITILDFDSTDRAADTMRGRNISVEDLSDVIAGEYEVTTNRPNHPAPYVLIGRDRSGRCLVIVSSGGL